MPLTAPHPTPDDTDTDTPDAFALDADVPPVVAETLASVTTPPIATPMPDTP